MPQYISTGKINFPKTLLSLIVAIPAAIIVGIIYAWLVDLVSFIIIDFLMIVIATVMMMGLVFGVVQLGAIRNNAVKMIVAVIVCLIAWYSQWAFSTQHRFIDNFLNFGRVFEDILDWCNSREITISHGTSSGGAGISGIGLYILYGFELLCFISPIFMIWGQDRHYFCETCGKFNKNSTFYVRDLDERQAWAMEPSGDFRFITTLQPSKELPQIVGPAWNVEISSCPVCGQDGVISIDAGQISVNPKDKKLVFKKERTVIEHTLMNGVATSELRSQFS